MRLTRVLRSQRCVKDVIKQIYEEGSGFGFVNSPKKVSNKSKTVVVEYSSPNIAKPFHTGHLRSTILGNFVSNLYEHLGWNVIRLNYLGDWGTQFGILIVGFQKYGCEKALAENPLHHLFEVYVKVNTDVQTEKSQNEYKTFQAGLAAFQKMEEGDEEYLQLWRRFRDISTTEYNKVYKRMGIHFTEDHFESMYAEASLDILNRLKDEGKIETDDLGRRCVTVNDNEKEMERSVVLQKSDGTSLYLTRDLAAIQDRYDKYKFDKIHYVVEEGQMRHFQDIKLTMEHLPEWKNRINDDIHIKFGRINGMSTRKGNVVFLSDLFDKAKQTCKQTLIEKETTKVTGDEIEDIVEELGRSAIYVQDLNKQRLRNYKFTWDRMLYFNQDSGVFLHYCHSRLCNLEVMNDIKEYDMNFNQDVILGNSQACHLISELQKYCIGVDLAVRTLEPHYIVKYILNICHATNQAYKTCNVKFADPEVAKAYLHMFRASRLVIANGMRLLGLNPLQRM